jgi:hypothetical protein
MNFSVLNAHIQKLIHLHQQCIESNRLLSDENNALRKQTEHQKQLILELENSIKAKTMASALNNSDKKDALKEELERYIKEIDRCIALINSEPL